MSDTAPRQFQEMLSLKLFVVNRLKSSTNSRKLCAPCMCATPTVVMATASLNLVLVVKMVILLIILLIMVYA